MVSGSPRLMRRTSGRFIRLRHGAHDSSRGLPDRAQRLSNSVRGLRLSAGNRGVGRGAIPAHAEAGMDARRMGGNQAQAAKESAANDARLHAGGNAPAKIISFALPDDGAGYSQRLDADSPAQTDRRDLRLR